MAPTLSDEAINVLTIVKELNILDTTGFKTLEQLFANRVSDDLSRTLVDGKESRLALVIYKVATRISAADPLGYVLRFLSDLVQASPKVAAAFAVPDANEVFGSDPCQRFLEFADTNKQNPGVARPAVFLAAAVLRQSAPGSRQACVRSFLSTVSGVLSTPDFATCRDLEFTIHAVTVFVKAKGLRNDFREARLVQQLPRVLTYVCSNEAASMVQLMYETLLACWILSFDYRCLAVFSKEKLIAIVHRALQKAVKEKCIRMGLLILKNFAVAQNTFLEVTRGRCDWADASIEALTTAEGAVRPPAYFSDMIGIGVLKTLYQLQRKKYGDDDIAADLEYLINLLEANLDELTSFSEYKGEVDSKVLEWSPVHSSSKFWKENSRQFEKNNHEVLRNLVGLLDSQSDVTVAVACHDIGELVRYHPNGRMLLQLPSLNNPKTKIMHLMSHHNPEVARNALLAVQKIMVQRWEFLQN